MFEIVEDLSFLLELFASIHVRRPVMAFLQPLNWANDERIVVRPFTVDFVTLFNLSLYRGRLLPVIHPWRMHPNPVQTCLLPGVSEVRCFISVHHLSARFVSFFPTKDKQ